MSTTTENTTDKHWAEIREYAKLSAAEYGEQNADMDPSDYAHEQANGAYNVIYSHEAWRSCMACREHDSELWDASNDSLMDTCGDEMGKDDTIDTVIVRLAYWIHYHAIMTEIEATKPDTDEED